MVWSYHNAPEEESSVFWCLREYAQTLGSRFAHLARPCKRSADDVGYP